MSIVQQPDSTETRTGDATSFLMGISSQLTKLSAGLARIKKEKSPTRKSQLLSALSMGLRDLASASAEAQRLSESMSHEASVAFLQLDAVIRDMCEENSWRLDGHWPDFFIDLAVSLHINDKARIIEIHGKPFGVDELESAIGNAVRDARATKVAPAEFMATIVAAYDKLCTPETAQIAILEIYKQIIIDMQSAKFWRDAAAASFRPFSVDQFRAQTSRMLEAGVSATADGRELRLVPPLNPKDAIFMYQPADRRFGFVGRLEFVRP